MCGLIVAQLKRPWLQPDRLKAALGTIAHRGPDGTTTWFSEDRLTLMGHVRLSIIGLANGDQPLTHDRGDLHAVVNGEFYGYKHIREDLRAQGYRFQTESDSEIALHLYDEYGLGFVDHLRGEYALVISDRRSSELIAVRDRFGVKPLFYSVIDGEVFFASEIKALLALGVPARWDADGVMSELANVRGHSTMFDNIHQVPPGGMVIAKGGSVRIERYWDNVYPTEADLLNGPRTESEMVSGFRRVLDEAVQERLTADVEVACYLSGGLDSSAVLGLAQAKLDQPIRAFTIAFEGEFDESPLAERTAAFTGSNYEPISVSPQELGDAFSDAIWHAERTIFNANTIAKFMLSRAVRDAGIKVVLTGEGADEMMAGYPWERRDLMLFGNGYACEDERRRAIAELIERNPLSKSFMSPTGTSAPGCDLFREALGFCPSWIESLSYQYMSLTGLMKRGAPGMSDLSQPYKTMLSELDLPGRMIGRDAVNASLYAWQKTGLPNFILTVLADRMEMAHSVEGRVPFLDHKVAEYAASLPVTDKIRGMTEKYAIREATRDVITPELYARQKHPFLAPPIKNKKPDPLLNRCEEIIRGPSFSDQPFFDQKKACDLLDSLPEMDNTQSDQASLLIMRMASLSLMQQRFGVSN